MARRLYSYHKQFDDICEFKNAIVDVWEDLSAAYLEKIYLSILRIIIFVIDNNDKATKY